MLRGRVIGQTRPRDPGGMIIGQAGLQLVDELVRRKDPQRRCRELDRQRDPVEAAADRRREHRVRGRRLDLRVADPGAGEGNSSTAGFPGEDIRVGPAARRHRQRLDPDHALAWGCRARSGWSRGSSGPASGPRQVAEGGRGRPHVLDGVEDEDAGCAASVSARLSTTGRPGSSATPMAPAIAGRTSWTGRSRRRAARTRRDRHAAARPGGSARPRGGSCPRRRSPRGVMNVRSRPSARRRTVATSASRPINGASGTSGTAPGQHGLTVAGSG